MEEQTKIPAARMMDGSEWITWLFHSGSRTAAPRRPCLVSNQATLSQRRKNVCCVEPFLVQGSFLHYLMATNKKLGSFEYTRRINPFFVFMPSAYFCFHRPKDVVTFWLIETELYTHVTKNGQIFETHHPLRDHTRTLLKFEETVTACL